MIPALPVRMLINAALYYTVFTVAGCIYAHYVSLKKEKGATAVGANAKYAQIPAEDWQYFQRVLEEAKRVSLQGEEVALPSFVSPAAFQDKNDASIATLTAELSRVRDIAGQAYDITVGLIPDAGIRAVKFDGATVVVGMDQQPKKG